MEIGEENDRLRGFAREPGRLRPAHHRARRRGGRALPGCPAEGLAWAAHRDRTTRNDFIDAVIDGMIHGCRQRQAQVAATAVAEIDAGPEGNRRGLRQDRPASKELLDTDRRSYPYERNLSGVRRERRPQRQPTGLIHSGRALAAMGGASVRPYPSPPEPHGIRPVTRHTTRWRP